MNKIAILCAVLSGGLSVFGETLPFFRLRDVVQSAWIDLAQDQTRQGIHFRYEMQKKNNAEFYTVTLEDRSGKDRALTFSASLRCRNRNTVWLHDLSGEEQVHSGKRYANYSPMWTECGMNGRFSHYPFGAIIRNGGGVGIGIDLLNPALNRIEYDGDTEEFGIFFEPALIKERPKVTLKFCIFQFSPEWQFRSALQRYYELFPEYFARRIESHGILVPFASISKIPAWRDFGIRFKEGDAEARWEHENGILTFRYWEPCSWWMKMPESMPRTYEKALELAEKMAREGNLRARSLFSSGFQDRHGRFRIRFGHFPWNNGGVWSLNPLPGIPGEVTCFNLGWNPEKLHSYRNEPQKYLAGEFFDSLEGFMIDPIDYRRSNLAAATVPLSFNVMTRQPVIFKGMAIFEFLRQVSGEIHGQGKLVIGNNAPRNWAWTAPFLDFAVTETEWLKNGRWTPLDFNVMLYYRAISRHKPFGLVQNADFDHFDSLLVEKFMRRCTALGILPSCFSGNASGRNYFRTPAYYERDRHLFRKYLPWCRKLSEAGWEPISRVRADGKDIRLERFGENYFTVFNDSPRTRKITLRFDDRSLNKLKNWPGEAYLNGKDGVFELTVQPEDLRIIEPVRSSAK